MRRSGERLCIALLTSAVVLTTGQAQGQTAPQPKQAATSEVAPLTVTGTRPRPSDLAAGLPGTEAPRSATCEYLATNDPSFRHMVNMGVTMIKLPTRPPRNPDYSAPPLTPPGSALPVVRARGEGRYDTTATSYNASMDSSQTSSFFAGGREGGGVDEPDLKRAINACRAAYNPGGKLTFDIPGRIEIAYRDKLIPMGFALFDEGRYEESLDWFHKAYARHPDEFGGDEAALMVGKIYLFGLGKKTDTDKAIFWLKRAAGARFNVSNSLPVFDPKEPDRNTAIGEAALILGNVYLTGMRGAPKNPVEARKWYERSFYVGHVTAAKILGDIHYNGVGTPKDLAKAMAYYKQAAELNHPAAQYALADILYRGEHGAPDIKMALAWYSAAAASDHSGAAYALALAYDTGEGVAADPQKAVGFYKTAATLGNTDAQSAMGTYFYEGEIVARDHAMARKWFETAATAGQRDAMFNLATMLTKGEGGDRDLVKAWVWFSIAKTGGHPNAAPALAALEKRMTGEEKQAAVGILSPRKAG